MGIENGLGIENGWWLNSKPGSMVSEAATLCQLCHNQCDQIKIAKCLQKLPKNDLTRKMIDFDTFTKIA